MLRAPISYTMVYHEQPNTATTYIHSRAASASHSGGCTLATEYRTGGGAHLAGAGAPAVTADEQCWRMSAEDVDVRFQVSNKKQNVHLLCMLC